MSYTCDVCGGPITDDSQVTADAVVCDQCIERQRKEMSCVAMSRPLPEPGSRDLTDTSSYDHPGIHE